MIYFLLFYIVGQLAYHHALSAFFIGSILLVSMVIKRKTLLTIFCTGLVCLLGYYIETFIPPQQTDSILATAHSSSEASIHTAIHLTTLPIKKDTYYTAEVTTQTQPYRLIFGDFSNHNGNYNAYFWATHVCHIDATIKPPTEYALLPTLFVNQLDMSRCTIKTHLSWTDTIKMTRNIATERLLQSQLPGNPYIIALVTGTTDYIPFDQKQLLKELGISHLFAVSGTHVGILTGLLYTIGKRLPIPLYIIQILLLAILPIFLIFSGNSPSAQRAVVMAALVIIFARFIQQSATHILLYAYICVSLFNPAVHYHLGFQYSFAICFLLITLRTTYLHQHFLKSIFTTSFIAVLGTIPISYQHFNELQWLGLISNIFFIPLYSLFIIPLSFLTTFLAIICPSVLCIFTYPFSLFFKVHMLLIHFLKMLTHLKIILPSYGEFGYFLMIVVVSFTAYLLAKQQYKKLVCFIIIWLCVMILWHPHFENRMTLIDVGQGDAILFEAQTGETLLIDTGGVRESSQHAKQKYSITDRKLYPLLKRRGIYKIDYLVITHPHADHMGELEHLAHRMNISNIIINPNHFDSINAKKVRSVLRQEQAKLWDYRQISHLQLGDYDFQFLDSDIDTSDDPNEHSIVTLVRIHQTTVMLMGDATVDNEAKLMTNYSLEKVDILKVGHHGSKTSSSEVFLDAINPEVALLSVAKHNMYRLPNPLILDRFKKRGIPIYSTANNHHVIVNFDIQSAQHYTLSSESTP
ncbi:DNA internalization-related competence protein ComEC/Rec2 [Staphylococcus americanisciuri]|uniref:DNA internalization-related competence protein ComEC/Rec2 n=1 Tax=Staphylococcus americanisciuri TaxID=2973940 RepID=A0ABT2EZC2_9STAP|nr:DNA internalization-related competence protein ComEC/Rec2 [Staphylococcus americanisciuri]MCS4485572.1 DNA internalization-related competence protein ComEC/Rec2 [Staphylococcus americanisciuri]